MCSYLKDNLNWIIPLFITTVFSIVTIVFSVLNYRIVKQQRELQNDSFCFQLFDRRLNVYTSIKEIISDVIMNDSVPSKELTAFLQKERDVEYLFGKDVSDCCLAIYNILVKLHGIETISNSPSKKGQVAADLADEETRLLEELSNKGQQLHDLVVNYISFSEYKPCNNAASKKLKNHNRK